MEQRAGYYAGTEIDGKWWRRYRHDGFLVRGNGEFWIEEQALVFRRYLIKPLVRIPMNRIDEISISSWHAGRWALSKRMIKIKWSQNGEILCSGFVLARDESTTRELVEDLSRVVESNRSDSA